MAEVKPDKQKEALTAMKNANQHLNEIFKKMHEMDATLSSVETALRNAASQCGKLGVETWRDGKMQQYSLSMYLIDLATHLNKVRL